MQTKTFALLLIVAAVMTITSGQSNWEAMNSASSSLNSPKGKPNFHLNGAGGGQNLRNFGSNFNLGVGAKVYESKNGRHSIGVGSNYQQSFGSYQGQSWRSKPSLGVGAAYRFKF